MNNGELRGGESRKPFRVLSLDGGGIRGVFSAHMLSLMEKEMKAKAFDLFDLIVGTSTGSIIAGAIAIKYPLSELVKDYEFYAAKIFKKSRLKWWYKRYGFFCSKYNNKPLEDFLHKVLGDRRLGEIHTPLILNATNATTSDVYVFKSNYQKEKRNGDYIRDKDIPLFRAVLASCSAPTYFNPVAIKEALLCDGGLWANNPALVGYVDAKKNFQAENVKIFSFGTGKSPLSYMHSKNWGYLTGWKKTKLIDFVMSCQTKFPQNVLELINKEGIFRVNPQIEKCDFDEFEKIPYLKSLAESEFTKTNEKIKKFLGLGGKNETQ